MYVTVVFSSAFGVVLYATYRGIIEHHSYGFSFFLCSLVSYCFQVIHEMQIKALIFLCIPSSNSVTRLSVQNRNFTEQLVAYHSSVSVSQTGQPH
uniref:Uncharacterized protein n=1 Tax=Kalanchoe fedtschenkoi TaxID=63787 RepID=A0A7N0RFE2_KALFE